MSLKRFVVPMILVFSYLITFLLVIFFGVTSTFEMITEPSNVAVILGFVLTFAQIFGMMAITYFLIDYLVKLSTPIEKSEEDICESCFGLAPHAVKCTTCGGTGMVKVQSGEHNESIK